MEKEQINQLLDKQRQYFYSGATLDLDFRISALKRLRASIRKHEDQIHAALKKDLGKSNFESYMCETGLVLSEITHMLKNIRSYAKEETVPTPLAQFHSRSFRKPSPYGVVLIMSPWNYPFLLTIEPLVDAIAAGNTAILKPSAYSPATSEVIRLLIHECFDEKYVATKLTQNDMTIVADQLTDSMGRMFYIWLVFAVALYMLMVYLLSKIILEKNSNAISIVKILGYKGNEIMRLYVAATAIVVFISLVISVPLSDFTIGFLWRAIMGTYPGWLAYKAPSYVLVEMFVIGVAAYSIIGALQYKKIRKIPMDEALKNVE